MRPIYIVSLIIIFKPSDIVYQSVSIECRRDQSYIFYDSQDKHEPTYSTALEISLSLLRQSRQILIRSIKLTEILQMQSIQMISHLKF